MAVRNRWFRIALLAFSASYLFISAKGLIQTVQYFQDHRGVELELGVLIAFAAFVVHAGGLAMLAGSFGPRIDWQRLKVGAVVVGSAYLGAFVSTVLILLSALGDSDQADYRGTYLWTTIAAGLAVVAVAVILAALRQGRCGPDLAGALRTGLAVGALSVGSAATAYFYQWSHYTSQRYVHELTVGTLIAAVTQIAIALLVLAVAVGIRRPLRWREGCLGAAAAGLAIAASCGVVGQLLVAVAYSSHGARTSDDLIDWLGVGYGLLAAAGYAAIALGSRSAATGAATAIRTVAAGARLVRRNLDFRTAALATAGASLVVAGEGVLEAAHLLGSGDVSFGLEVASVVSAVAPLAGAAGWAVVALSFDLEVDWRRLRLGAAAVACAYVGTYASSALVALDLPDARGDIKDYLAWTSIGAFLFAAGALVVVSGLGDSKRGAARGLRLQIGLVVAAVSAAAVSIAIFDLHSYFDSTSGFVQLHRIGALVIAIAQLGVALAIVFFALEARSSLPRREGMLVKAAGLGALATLGLVVGQGLIAYAYNTRGQLEWRVMLAWLATASPFVSATGIAFLALGARSAREDAAPLPDELALDPP